MDKCAMLGCKESTYKYLSIGPGTYIGLCEKHSGKVEKETSYTKPHTDNQEEST